MSKKIIGVTVGTPISPKKLSEKLSPVKTVNGKSPDANGNVELDEIAGYESLTLGVHTNGLIYLFKNGEPQGVGLEIKAEEVEGGDVVGYIDENNNIVLKGNLTEGTYTAKYEMADGTTIEIGQLVFSYSVTSTLTNCSSNNSATSVANGGSYKATISANSGYELSTLTATMEGGGTIIVDKATGEISSDKVTGNIVITAVATATATGTPANFCVPNGDGWINNGRCSSTGEDRTNGVAGWHCSNYISVKNGDIVYVENADLCTLTNQYCGMYKPDKTALGGFMINVGVNNDVRYVNDVDLTSEVEKFTIDNEIAGYVRVVLKPHSTNDDIVIKIERDGKWRTA